MFKSRHQPGSPQFILNTPKISKRSLSPDETSSVPSRPTTRMGTRPPTPMRESTTNPRNNPTSGQPALPLKSILKKVGNTSPNRMGYDSEGETLTSKKVSRSGVYDVRNLCVPGVRMGKSLSPYCSPALTFLTYDLSDRDPCQSP